jgi:hypothetical protein
MFGPSLHWIDWWRRAAALGWRNFDRLAALHDPYLFRDRWLADLRLASLDYTKSPAFLALMRLNLTMLTHPTTIKAAQMFALPTR